MKNSCLPTRVNRSRGLSLPEVLISLAICSSLLVAVASAYVGASRAITNNNDFTRATQAARVILAQFEEQVRTGTPNSGFTVDGSGNITALTILTAGGTYRTYTYNSSAKQLLLYAASTTTGTSYVVARNVSTCSMTALTGTDANGLACVTQASMTITVAVGNNSITLSGSAAPRKSMVK